MFDEIRYLDYIIGLMISFDCFILDPRTLAAPVAFS
jgi:hypothetical protein